MRCPLQHKAFYGREWALSKLAAYLDSRAMGETGVPGVLVVGGPGSGKTALCCELLWPSRRPPAQPHLADRVLAHYFCHRFHLDSLSPAYFLASIASQLLESPQLPQFRQLYEQDAEMRSWLEEDRVRASPREALLRAVLEPLASLEPPVQPLLLVIDSLHEAADVRQDANEGLLGLVGLLVPRLPPWILLVATSRRGCSAVSQRVAGFRKLTLDDLRRSAVVKDVQQYILARLDTEDGLKAQLDAETAEMLNQLHIKSAGCLLYLEMVLDGVRDGFIRLREVQHMPCTLNGFYLWLCQRLFGRRGSFAAARLLLDVLLATRYPLRLPELLAVAVARQPTLSHSALVSILQSLHQLVLEFKAAQPLSQEKFLLIIHSSFIEWLLDVKYCTRKYLCEPSEGHAALTLWYASRGPELTPDELQLFAYHLAHGRAKLFPQASEEELEDLGPAFLVQSGAAVGDLVLAAPSYDSDTTRLLITAGADFTRLSSSSPRKHLPEVSGHSPTTSDASVRSDNEVLVDETLLDHQGTTVLHKAAREGRHGSVRRMLSKGAYCDVEDGEGETPLCAAARLGHTLVLLQLLDSGADPQRCGAGGWSPLRCAAWGGHLETVEALLSRGRAQADYAGADQRSPLRAAAWGGHEDVVNRLLSAGADPAKVDAEGRSPLMAAAYMGQGGVVSALLAAGADPNHQDLEGSSALAVAAVCSSQSGDHIVVAQLLLGGAGNPDSQDRYGRTPLFLAAMEGHTDIARLLLAFGADVDLPDTQHNTPLLAAAASGEKEMVETLLEKGASPDAIDVEGRTVLSLAALQGSVDVVKCLLSKGLDEMHRDNAGWLPVHHAAAEGQAGAVTALVEHKGGLVRERDHEGRTALVLAAEEGRQEAVNALLNHGSPVDLPTINGQTALRHAAVAGQRAVCKTLVAAGADTESRDVDGASILFSLVLEQELELAEFFLGLGVRVNAHDNQGRSPLYVASWQNDVKAINLLLKYGADINQPDKDGRTPLMAALWQGCWPAVQCLVQRKADLNIVCEEGATALNIAAQLGLDEAVALLVRHGANVAHRDSYGRTAADVADKAGKGRIANILRAAAAASPLTAHRHFNTVDSNHNSASSGFVSAMDHSLESSGLALSPLPEKSRRGGNSPILKGSPLLPHGGVVVAGRSASATSSKQSTLSSCGSPEEDFRGQLMQRSLPRPASMRLSCYLAEDFDPYQDPGASSLLRPAGDGRRRPGIATNPKVRKPSVSSLVPTPSSSASLLRSLPPPPPISPPQPPVLLTTATVHALS